MGENREEPRKTVAGRNLGGALGKVSHQAEPPFATTQDMLDSRIQIIGVLDRDHFAHRVATMLKDPPHTAPICLIRPSLPGLLTQATCQVSRGESFEGSSLLAPWYSVLFQRLLQ